MSTVAWIAVYDILLTFCDLQPGTPTLYAYADDLVNTSTSTRCQDSTAYLISAFCAATGLQIAAQKVENIVIHPKGPVNDELFIYDHRWNTTKVPYAHFSSFRYL